MRTETLWPSHERSLEVIGLDAAYIMRCGGIESVHQQVKRLSKLSKDNEMNGWMMNEW